MKRCSVFFLKDRIIVVSNSRDEDWIWFESTPIFIVSDVTDYTSLYNGINQCLDGSKMDATPLDTKKWEDYFFHYINIESYSKLNKQSKQFGFYVKNEKLKITSYVEYKKGKPNMGHVPSKEIEMDLSLFDINFVSKFANVVIKDCDITELFD